MLIADTKMGSQLSALTGFARNLHFLKSHQKLIPSFKNYMGLYLKHTMADYSDLVEFAVIFVISPEGS